MARENAEERAYKSILHLILTGEYRPGDFLLEQHLAERFEMSRTPVSRALHKLITEGFLEKMPKKGCRIPIPSPQDAEHVFTAREVVEGNAAALAAEHAADSTLADLAALSGPDRDAVANRERESFAEVNEALHLGIARASGNPYLERWCRNMFWRSNVYIFYFDSFYHHSELFLPQQTPVQHAAVIEALQKRDAAAAREAMADHIRYTYRQLLLTNQ
ncbi:MAG: GntR family transcriptional regulator [Synergistales bacterium]|nr:GntR family transcriptional regulator [Synergistales bacterium]